jgi:hypothetical protein
VSDARWIKIEKAVASSVENFAKGVEFTRHPGFQSDDLIDSAPRMGFMHAIQAGHTSLENALLRMLDLMDEARPSGDTNRRCQCPPVTTTSSCRRRACPKRRLGSASTSFLVGITEYVVGGPPAFAGARFAHHNEGDADH